MTTYDTMYIGGHWQQASDGATLEIVDPATEKVIGEIPRATPADIDTALDSAAQGWRIWRESDAWTRSRVLRIAAELIRERAHRIADVLTEEQGKPLGESRGEVAAAADQFDWYADEARRIYGRVIDGRDRADRLMVIRQPVGPVAAFTAWNFPALLPARKVAPALAAGCSLILKPAEEAPRTALMLAETLTDAGLPAGALNVVTGDPEQISEQLIASPIIRKVSLTGSVPVGRKLLHLAADRIVPVSMELGGHAPVLVLEDAQLDPAIEACLAGKFRNAGQVCAAPSRFFVHESLEKPFAEGLAAATRRLRLGDGRDPETDVGPLSNHRRLQAAGELIEDATAKGATLLCGGRRSPAFDRGLFFEPTVLAGVNDGMEIMRSEPFSPIAPVAPFSTLEDGLQQANATTYGLAGFVFTQNLKTAMLAAEGLEVGMVGVNKLVIATAEAPFGGVKESGFGREGGTEGIDAYTVPKYMNLRL